MIGREHVFAQTNLNFLFLSPGPNLGHAIIELRNLLRRGWGSSRCWSRCWSRGIRFSRANKNCFLAVRAHHVLALHIGRDTKDTITLRAVENRIRSRHVLGWYQRFRNAHFVFTAWTSDDLPRLFRPNLKRLIASRTS